MKKKEFYGCALFTHNLAKAGGGPKREGGGGMEKGIENIVKIAVVDTIKKMNLSQTQKSVR
jgi:hypothetical protein